MAGENYSPGGRREGAEGAEKMCPLHTDEMPRFVCLVLSGCFPDPITVKGNDIWE